MNKFYDAFISNNYLRTHQSDIETFYKTHVEQLMFQTEDEHIITAARLRLTNPIGTLVIIPGRGEVPHKFADFFMTLYKLNIDCVVCFTRGQANSSRVLTDNQKCHVNKFEDFASDVMCILKNLNITHNFNILAFSLGGLVTLDLLKNSNIKPTKVALIAPYLWPYFKLPDCILKAFVFTLGSLPIINEMYTPHGKEYKRLEFIGNHHSHDDYRFTSYHDYFAQHPEITVGGPTYKFVKEAMRKQMEILNSNFSLPVPVYCQSAGQDKVVSTAVAKTFFEEHRHDKFSPKFEVIDYAYHDIMNESDKYRIISLSKALEFLFSENWEEK